MGQLGVADLEAVVTVHEVDGYDSDDGGDPPSQVPLAALTWDGSLAMAGRHVVVATPGLHLHGRLRLPATALGSQSNAVLVAGVDGSVEVLHTGATAPTPLAPIPLAPTHTGAAAVTAMTHGGLGHTLMLHTDGSVTAFGDNAYGQCCAACDAMPSRVVLPGGSADVVCSIAAGWHHSAAVTARGELFTWGLNTFGQCGTPSDSCRGTPTPAAAVAGSKRARDDGGGGALPPPPTDADALSLADVRVGTPTLVSTPRLHIVAVACGGAHTLVLARDGTLLAVGNGIHGQLGLPCALAPDLSPADAASPCDGPGDPLLDGGATSLCVDTLQAVSWPLPAPPVAIAAGGRYSLAAAADGSAAAWGAAALPVQSTVPPCTWRLQRFTLTPTRLPPLSATCAAGRLSLLAASRTHYLLHAHVP